MIFKIQKPLHDGNTFLIYNKDKSIFFILDEGEYKKIYTLFKNDIYKIYCDGNLNKKGIFTINKVVSNKSW